LISERKRKEGEFRKEIILTAAEKVFGKKPYDKVSVLDISKESGVCLQSIYNLFGSKKELYKNMVLFRISKFQKALDEALKKKNNSLTLLKEWTKIFFSAMADFPQFFPVFLRERFHYEWGVETTLFSELHDVFEKEEKRLEYILRKAQKENYLKKDVPIKYLKSVFFYFVQSKLEYHFRFEKCLEVKQCVEEIFCDFLSGLKQQ